MRLGSILLLFAMLLTLLPVTALAAEETGFSDVPSSAWYYDEVQYICEEGLMNGTGNGAFSPDVATRAQIAVILYRFCTGEDGTKPGEETYTVTFNLNYTGAPAAQTVRVENGKTVSAPANPTRSGYNFAGWYTQASGGSRFSFTTPITSDLTLYARWTAQVGGGGGGGGSTPAVPVDVVYDNGDPNDVKNIYTLGITVSVNRDGDTDVIALSGEVDKGDLADLTDLPTGDSSYDWAEDVAFTYAYFKLPDGADYVNFGDQISVPSPSLIKLDGSTTDGQVVTIDGARYYKMVIQFAHKTKGADWALSVGSNNPDNIVEYTFTAGTVQEGTYSPMQTYNLTLDYSQLTITGN